MNNLINQFLSFVIIKLISTKTKGEMREMRVSKKKKTKGEMRWEIEANWEYGQCEWQREIDPILFHSFSLSSPHFGANVFPYINNNAPAFEGRPKWAPPHLYIFYQVSCLPQSSISPNITFFFNP